MQRFKQVDLLTCVRKVGVEIELEFTKLFDPEHFSIPSNLRKDVKAVKDGSLRNGLEFIFNGPKYVKDSLRILEGVEAAVSEVDRYFKETKGQEGVHLTDRCSIHVHVDFTGYDSQSVQNFIAKYLVIEGLLFLWVDPIRKKNNFCKGLQNNYLTNNILTYSPFGLIRDASEKYSALNMRTLETLGTLEFRHHHGSYSAEEIFNWISIIINAVDYLEQVDFNQLLSDVSSTPNLILSKMFGTLDIDLKEANLELIKGARTLRRVLERDRLFNISIPMGTLTDFHERYVAING